MSFPRHARYQYILVAVFAVGVAASAATAQEGATASSAAPRAIAPTPPVATNVPSTGVAPYPKSSVKVYRDLLGEAGGGSFTEPVLVVPGKPLEAQALGQAVEDLSVMSRIIEKNVLGDDAGAGGAWGMIEYRVFNTPGWSVTGPATLFPSMGRAKPMYIGGYGALFFMQVNYPLLPPPETPQEQPAGQPQDSVWAEARRSVLEPQAGVALPQEEGEGVEPYSREQVDALRTAVVATLKHATNIRVLEPADRIAIVVQGPVAVATQGSSPVATGLALAAAPAGRTMLTVRTTKADVDQYAKGQLDQKQFEQRVQIVTY